LGFTQVYRYTAGKMDWFAHGLPIEGDRADAPRAGKLAQRDVPICHPTERVGEVRQRVEQAGWGVCVVVNDERVVLGLLWGEALDVDADPHTPVEEVMDCAPSTVRPHLSPEEAAEYAKEMDGVLVTTADGKLLGLLHLDTEGDEHEHHDH
jgi:CBS domain-containing protein